MNLSSAASRIIAHLGVVTILAMSGASIASAATAASLPGGDAFPAAAGASAPANTADCFAYYHFGSVQVNVDSSVSTAVSGTPITFTGDIKNNNPYPIVDGALYIKVFRLKASAAKDPNGPDVVDQYFVRTGINLPANGSLPVAFTWDIPSYTSSGEYRIATFFTTSKKFNLLGLSFTDDVVGNTVNFSVSGEQQKIVAFDKSSATVAGHKYYFAAFPPTVSATSSVPVTATIRNTTAQNALVPVSWKLYSWDAGQVSNLVAESDTQISVSAGKSAVASYTVTDTRYPVYLLVGTMGWGNTQSIVNIRLVRSGIDRTRINFPGVTAFPLRKGQEATLFSCLHNSGESAVVPGGKLVLTLTDDSGALIHEYTYTGDVTGAMMGVADKFTPAQNYDVFNLVAKLYQGTTLVDSATLRYDCSSIDKSLCLPANMKSAPSDGAAAFSPVVLGAAGAVVVIVLLAGAAVIVRRRPTGPQI